MTMNFTDGTLYKRVQILNLAIWVGFTFFFHNFVPQKRASMHTTPVVPAIQFLMLNWEILFNPLQAASSRLWFAPPHYMLKYGAVLNDPW